MGTSCHGACRGTGPAGNGVRRAPSTAPSARVSIWESVRGCGLWGKEVDKAELRKQVVMPLYLRRAVAEAVAAKDEAAGVAAAEGQQAAEEEGPVVAPVVVFVNSKSGGRHGPELKVRLHELISEEQVMTSGFAARMTLVQLCLTNFGPPLLCFRANTCCLIVRSALTLSPQLVIVFFFFFGEIPVEFHSHRSSDTYSFVGFPPLGEH